MTKVTYKRKSAKRRAGNKVREIPAPLYHGRQLVAVSLFSGAGGLDLGVEKAGFKSLACVEFDPFAVETLNAWTQRTGATTKIISADIRTVNPLDLAKPGIDLLHGGPPCQAFSLIGKRGSLTDERGMLLFEMVRFAKALQPRVILTEQVKGVLSAPDHNGERGGVLKRFIADLEKLGYCVKWSVVCAADYGVPQVRERVFFIAIKGENGFYFPPPTHSENPEDTPLFTLKPYVGVGKVLDDLPPPGRREVPEVFPNHVDVTPARDQERIHGVPEGSFLACQLHLSKDVRRNLNAKKDTTKYRRLNRSEPSLTLRCGEIFFHPIEDRYLTPRECMRIHGYPDEHILRGPIRSRSGRVRQLDQHRQVANSVPPPLGYVMAAAIARHLQ